MSPSARTPVGGSFRDPLGYVFLEDGLYKRAITPQGIPDYELFISSGLYRSLSEESLVLRHLEEGRPVRTSGVSKTLVPEQIPYVSYPYEWSFSQLKDAALLTLEIQERVLRHGMSLKDASAFNVQFRGPRPVFIDTSSFERNDGGPWIAYQQFCRHFLAPLLLMGHASALFNQFLSASLDGFPLDLTSRLLPLKTYLRAGPLLHIHLHARALRNVAPAIPNGQRHAADRKQQIAASLKAAVESTSLPHRRTEWSEYYGEACHYSAEAASFKKECVRRWLGSIQPRLVFDLGANTGEYSRLAAGEGFSCVSFEMDAACAEENYRNAKQDGNLLILPLRMDLTAPSPGLGFDLSERMSLLERPAADAALALAIIHHLRITGQIPFARLARFLARLGRYLLIEFIPKDDPMVQRMLRHRKDVFDDYSKTEFLESFGRYFDFADARPIPSSRREVFFLRKRYEDKAG